MDTSTFRSSGPGLALQGHSLKLPFSSVQKQHGFEQWLSSLKPEDRQKAQVLENVLDEKVVSHFTGADRNKSFDSNNNDNTSNDSSFQTAKKPSSVERDMQTRAFELFCQGTSCDPRACTPSWSHPSSSAPPLNKDSLAARRKSQEMTQKIRSMIDHSKSLWYDMRRSGDQDLWRKQLVSTSHAMHKQEIKKKKAEKEMIFDYVRRSRPYFPGLFSEQVCEKLDKFFKSAPDDQRAEMLDTLRNISTHTKAEQYDSIYKRDYIRMRPTTAMGRSRMNEATPIVINKMLKEASLKKAYDRAQEKEKERKKMAAMMMKKKENTASHQDDFPKLSRQKTLSPKTKMQQQRSSGDSILNTQGNVDYSKQTSYMTTFGSGYGDFIKAIPLNEGKLEARARDFEAAISAIGTLNPTLVRKNKSVYQAINARSQGMSAGLKEQKKKSRLGHTEMRSSTGSKRNTTYLSTFDLNKSIQNNAALGDRRTMRWNRSNCGGDNVALGDNTNGTPTTSYQDDFGHERRTRLQESTTGHTTPICKVA